MSGLNLKQFKYDIVAPVLRLFTGYCPCSLNLLTGTAITESNLTYVKQPFVSDGGIGLYQMEYEDHDDIWLNFLGYHPAVQKHVQWFRTQGLSQHEDLVVNLAYQTVMARVHYMRVEEKLPCPTDAQGMALYHKKYYNTVKGKADPNVTVHNFQRAIDV